MTGRHISLLEGEREKMAAVKKVFWYEEAVALAGVAYWFYWFY